MLLAFRLRRIVHERQAMTYEQRRLTLDNLGVRVRLWRTDHVDEQGRPQRWKITASIPLDDPPDVDTYQQAATRLAEYEAPRPLDGPFDQDSYRAAFDQLLMEVAAVTQPIVYGTSGCSRGTVLVRDQSGRAGVLAPARGGSRPPSSRFRRHT